MAMNKILPTILHWLRLNPGKEPREFKAPKTEEERVEQKVSRCLRHLRGKAELGKLPNDVDDQLTKVFPTWKAQGRRLGHTKPPALALRDTLALLEWCRMHHSNVLVKKTFDPRMCDDEENHPKMWAILRYMKEVAEGPRAEDYATAITFLNDAFGDLWRHRRRDFRPRMVYGEGGMVMMGDEGSYQASYDGYSDYSESDDEDSFTRQCQYAKYASTTMNLAMVTTWLRENLGKMPREIKVPKDEGEMVEAKVGRTLRHFRTQAEQGRLPPDVSRQLSDIWPTWRSHYKRCGKPPALALRDAQALVDWCQNHHSNQLVRAHLNHGLCDDPANHARMWAILRYMKDVADGPRADEYAAACAIMDAAYPGQWRYKKRGPNFKLPAASRLKEERDELMAGSASGKRKASDYRDYSDDDNYSDDSSQPPTFRQRDMPPYPHYDPHRPPYMLPIPRPPPYNSGPTYIPTGYMPPPPFAGPYPRGPPLGPPPGPFRFEPPTSFSRYPDPHLQQEQPDEGAGQGDRDDAAGPATSLEAALQPAAPGERAEILMGATLGLLELAGASARAKAAKTTQAIEETEV